MRLLDIILDWLGEFGRRYGRWLPPTSAGINHPELFRSGADREATP